MSTPISKALLLSAALALSGCAGGGIGGSATGFGGDAARTVSVTSDRIVVAGPDGFCVDPSATRQNADTGFVLLGNCAAIANSRRADQPQLPAVLTAAVSAPGQSGRIADNLDGLDGFFRSDEGRALLSRSGRADAVTLRDTAIMGDVFLLRADDRSAEAIEGVQSEYWRAYLDIGPRIATLSVLALEGQTLSTGQSRATLNAFVDAFQAANRTPGDPGPSPVYDPPPRAAPPPSSPA